MDLRRPLWRNQRGGPALRRAGGAAEREHGRAGRLSNYNVYAFAASNVYHDINDGISNATMARRIQIGPRLGCLHGFRKQNGTALWYALKASGFGRLANFNNALMPSGRAIERDDRVFMSSFNGTAWAAQQQIGGIGSSSGVAWRCRQLPLRGLERRRGRSGNDYSSSSNGTTWTAQKQVAGVGTSTGPRLAVNAGKLYMAWKGVEGDQRIFYSSFNGTAWVAQQQITGIATSVGPAFSFNNALYAVWKGVYGDPGIYYASFNGTSWTAQKNIAGVGTSIGPSLAVFNNLLYAVWKGEFNDQRLFYSTFNGTAWTAQQQIAGVGTSVGAGLAVFGNKLFATWKGEGAATSASGTPASPTEHGRRNKPFPESPHQPRPGAEVQGEGHCLKQFAEETQDPRQKAAF